jgi:hypothetical protein
VATQLDASLGRNPAGPALLHALGRAGPKRSSAFFVSGAGHAMRAASPLSGAAAAALGADGGGGSQNWPSRAVGVYREALSAGYKPRPRVVERVLACLRQPQPPKGAAAAAAAAAFAPAFKACAPGLLALSPILADLLVQLVGHTFRLPRRGCLHACVCLWSWPVRSSRASST